MLLVKRLIGLLLAAVVACGPSPDARDARPSGELVVVVRQGPERVSFRPDVARIRAANEQLAGLLGHSIAIEIDGAILPQTHEGAQQVIADLVEVVTRDVHELTVERFPEELAYVRQHFRRLVVRYDPAEAARRTAPHDEHPAAHFDVPSGTVDVVLARATPEAIVRGSIGRELLTAARNERAARYAEVMPEQLPGAERGAWLAYRTGLMERPKQTPNVDVVGILGALWLVRKSELTSQAREWLFGTALEQLTVAYQHELPAIRALPRGHRFLVAETEFMRWLEEEQVALTLEERGKLAGSLWTESYERDRPVTSSPRSFPGFDRMSFAFTTIDLWLAAGHPRNSKALLSLVEPVRPVWKAGHLVHERVAPDRTGTGDRFYRWMFEDQQRTDVLARAVKQRDDELFAAAAFYEGAQYLPEVKYTQFLRSFEDRPAQWRIGAAIFDQSSPREGGAVFEEARRLWRDVPGARAHALLWLAKTNEGRQCSDRCWTDVVRDHVASDADLASFLELDVPAILLVPTVWPALPRQGRVRPLARRIEYILDRDPSLAGSMVHVAVQVAQQLCKERSPEAAELRAWADTMREKRPGALFSTVVEPSTCTAAMPAAPLARKPPPQRPQKKLQ